MTSTRSRRRGESTPPLPAKPATISAKPITTISSESTSVPVRCTCLPLISAELRPWRIEARPPPAPPRLGAVPLPPSVSGDQRNDQDRDDVRDLDHRVDRRTGRV